VPMRCERSCVLGRSIVVIVVRRRFVVADGEFTQVVHRTVVYIHVHLAANAFDAADVGVLPELPLSVEARVLHVIVGDPEGIALEFGRVEIGLFELEAGVDDRRRSVAPFGEAEPFESFFSQFFGSERSQFLNVEYGGEVSVFELDIVHEIAGLLVARHLGREIVVGAPHESILTGLAEIALKFAVEVTFSLSGFDKHKFDPCVARNGGGGHLFPIDVALVVADVEAVYGVAGRQFDISEQSVPATAVGGYDEAIEKEGENEDCNEATDPERAVVGVSERTFGPREWGRRLLASCLFFLSAHGLFLCLCFVFTKHLARVENIAIPVQQS